MIPNRVETTGIAVHYNQPNAQPPQTLLLAVAPQLTGSWTWAALLGVLGDTLRARSCGPPSPISCRSADRAPRAGRTDAHGVARERNHCGRSGARNGRGIERVRRRGRSHTDRQDLFLDAVFAPAAVSWNRLEGRPRKEDFTRSLRAEIRDPLWMLCRQWQFGIRAETPDRRSQPVFRWTRVGSIAMPRPKMPRSVRGCTAAGGAGRTRARFPMSLGVRVQVGRHFSRLAGNLWTAQTRARYLGAIRSSRAQTRNRLRTWPATRQRSRTLGRHRPRRRWSAAARRGRRRPTRQLRRHAARGRMRHETR